MIKKSWLTICLLLVSILFFVLVSAVDQTAQLPDNIDLNKLSDVGANTNSFLDGDLGIPSYLEIPAKILFGIGSGEALSFNVFIVLIALWIVLFLILKNVMEIVPFFSGSKSILGAFIVVCLIAVSGGIKESAMFFFGLGNTFSVMKEFGILTLILIVILIAVLGWGILRLVGVAKGKYKIVESETTGEKVGLGI